MPAYSKHNEHASHPRTAEYTHPQPSSQVTGRLGLCSQSLRCDCSWSRRSVAVQPNPALSHEICSLESMFRMMRGTGRRWASVTTVRSTGQICCCANHCVMQALQKACSQCGAWEDTDRQITESENFIDPRGNSQCYDCIVTQRHSLNYWESVSHVNDTMYQTMWIRGDSQQSHKCGTNQMSECSLENIESLYSGL